jgi:hypothetical protein
MTTIEREPTTISAPLEPDGPVFLAADGRRARRLRIAALTVTVFAVLWLAALAAGTLGFGSLPGFSVPKLANLGGGGTPPPPARSSEQERRSDERGSARPLLDGTVQRNQAGVAPDLEPRGSAGRGVTSPPRNAQPVRRTQQRPQPVQPAQPVQAQAPLPPPPPLRGRERRGLPAPPGHVRQTEPAPPPPGQRRGQETTTTTLLPPPPPPPGNGHGGGPKK